jgi:acetoin utilization deacetylase AcuC-like enzyme
MDEIFSPVVKQFKPDIILISAGFDAHFSDPLTDLNLTIQGFGNIVKCAKKAAERVCNGRIAILLEGGYNLNAVSQGILQEIAVLAGLDIDINESAPKINSEIKLYGDKLMTQIKETFGSYWKL